MNFISRFFSDSAIRIRSGTAYCIKGKMTSSLLRDVSSVAADSNI